MGKPSITPNGNAPQLEFSTNVLVSIEVQPLSIYSTNLSIYSTNLSILSFYSTNLYQMLLCND